MVYKCLGQKELATGDVDEDNQLIPYMIDNYHCRVDPKISLIADHKYQPQQYNAIILDLSLATNEADISRHLSI